jgi:hypothetical protein
MMKFFLYFSAFLISMSISFAQNNSKPDSSKIHRRILPPQQEKPHIILTDSIIENDKALRNFRDICPKSWNIVLNGDRMIIRAKDSIWFAYYNAAGRSIIDTSERNYSDTNYIKQHGKRILPEASFRFEYLWNQEKMDETTKFNNKLYNKTKDLKVKYHLENLREWHKWGESGFFGATPEEEERIKEYEKEKKSLDEQRLKFPMYISDNYSIFMEYKNWQSDLVNMVSKIYPEESIKKIDYALELFLQVPEDK